MFCLFVLLCILGCTAFFYKAQSNMLHNQWQQTINTDGGDEETELANVVHDSSSYGGVLW